MLEFYLESFKNSKKYPGEEVSPEVSMQASESKPETKLPCWWCKHLHLPGAPQH